MHAFMHSCIHAFMHSCIHACIYAYAYTHYRECMFRGACVRTCLHVCTCVHVCACTLNRGCTYILHTDAAHVCSTCMLCRYAVSCTCVSLMCAMHRTDAARRRCFGACTLACCGPTESLATTMAMRCAQVACILLLPVAKALARLYPGSRKMFCNVAS